MTNPNKPSWLAALNTPKIEPAADPSPTKEEHVEQLPQYDAPPPLDLSPKAIEPKAVTPNTKLPFTFDASAFEASIGTDVEPSAVVDQDIVVKADPEYKEHLLTSEKVSIHQEFDSLNQPVQLISRAFRSQDGYAEKVYKNAVFGRLGHGSPELDADAAKLESLAGEGAAGLTLDDIAPPLPFLPNEEALLPEPKAGLGPREEAKPWMANLTVTEQIAFDAHVKAVLGINPLHAAKLIRLKGFESKYVGTINTAEKAENHIVICVNNGEDPGGWEDSGHQAAIRAQHLLETTIKKQEKATQRARWQRYIIECREAWKDAIVYRNLQREVLEEAVKRAHIQYTDAKKMTFQEYLMMIEEAEE